MSLTIHAFTEVFCVNCVKLSVFADVVMVVLSDDGETNSGEGVAKDAGGNFPHGRRVFGCASQPLQTASSGPR